MGTVGGERRALVSCGERQRLALGRGLLGEPEVVILDEATSVIELEAAIVADTDLTKARGR